MRGVVILSIAALAMSGCMGTWFTDTPACSLQGYECKPIEGGWLLQDLHLQGDAELILSTGPMLTLRNVTITGADRIDLDILCACTVRGEGWSMEGAGPGSYGVWLQGGNGGADLRDGIVLDGFSVVGFDRGVLVGLSEGVVTIANATIDCPADGTVLDFRAGLATTGYRILDSTTSGCAKLSFGSDSSRPEGLPPLNVEIVRSKLRGSGIDSGGDAISQSARTHLDLRVDESVIADVRYAIHIREGESLELRNSTIMKTETGIGLSDDAVAHLYGAVIEENVHGIKAWHGARLEAEHSAFLNNGPRILGSCDSGAISGFASGWIHRSTFAGNSLAVDVYEPGFDATSNYWGRPTGPVPFGGFNPCTAVADAGERVYHEVSYLPFLTEAP